MSSNNSLSKELEDEQEIQFSFRDYLPNIKLTLKNRNTVTVSTSVKRKLIKYADNNGSHSQSHAVNMLLEENKILRQICSKVAVGINRAKKEGNVNFLIRVFADLGNPKEKQYYYAILKGCFD